MVFVPAVSDLMVTLARPPVVVGSDVPTNVAEPEVIVKVTFVPSGAEIQFVPSSVIWTVAVISAVFA